MEMVEEMFRSTTIADVLAEPGAVTPLCQEKKTFKNSSKHRSTQAIYQLTYEKVKKE